MKLYQEEQMNELRIALRDVATKWMRDKMQEKKSKPMKHTEIECTGNNDNGCFLDSCGHNCGCVGIQP